MPFTLTFLWDGPQTALFAPLAKCIPHTRALTAGPFMTSHRPLSVTNVQQICEAFDQFVSLCHFNFDNVEETTRGGVVPASHSLTADLTALNALSDRCPTLMTSRLHCRNWSRASGKWMCID
ncbi:hypothetical protein K438DRAFT_1769870 [Mycena galopus ATCC 62051]|nr:hypothetical protein K438DRAFT_1769870 [Mycena galopus ATCC 62051]